MADVLSADVDALHHTVVIVYIVKHAVSDLDLELAFRTRYRKLYTKSKKCTIFMVQRT
jgi:hypothetical protein